MIYYCIIFVFCFFFNFRKLLLSTNEVLYLLKQPLVGTLQKQLLLILTNYFCSLRSLPEIICFLWSTSVVLEDIRCLRQENGIEESIITITETFKKKMIDTSLEEI